MVVTPERAMKLTADEERIVGEIERYIDNAILAHPGRLSALPHGRAIQVDFPNKPYPDALLDFVIAKYQIHWDITRQNDQREDRRWWDFKMKRPTANVFNYRD